MNRNCIVVVETPLQLLCSYEVNYENVHYIIRLTGQGRNDLQTVNVAKFLGISFDLISSPAKSYFAFFKFLLLTTFKYHKTKSTSVFLGSYFSSYLRLLSYFFKNVSYLDDGLATLKLTDEKINLFTFIDIHRNNRLKVLKHDFKNLRSLVGDVTVSGNYFIGQPVVEKNILDENLYFDYISESAAESNGNLTYIPHRMESSSSIKKIMEIEGVFVLPIKMCIEIYFISASVKPCKVYSYSSSALLTLSKLFPGCESTFYISPAGSTLNERVCQQFLSNGLRAGHSDVQE